MHRLINKILVAAAAAAAVTAIGAIKQYWYNLARLVLFNVDVCVCVCTAPLLATFDTIGLHSSMRLVDVAHHRCITQDDELALAIVGTQLATIDYFYSI